MEPLPRFVGRVGPADAVTVANAVLGFAGVAFVLVDASAAARLILLAGVADGLDGLVARRTGGTPLGAYLDSLADVVSFGVAPALLVFGVVYRAHGPALTPAVAAGGIAAGLFVASAVVRLGLYTAYDVDDAETRGVQTTLAATVLAVVFLAGVDDLLGLPRATLLAGLAALFAYLMVTRVRYPELIERDAVSMGAVQVLAVAFPVVLSRAFPRVLLAVAAAYLVLAPRFYWR